jgi:8-oxo-dGTP diphosphatase
MTFSEVNRDKRGRVVSVAYLALVPWENLSVEDQMSNAELAWMPVTKLKHLAYDHDHMLKVALDRLASRATYTTIISKLMPEEFTLTSLEQAFEVVTGKPLDKRNFRKKVDALGIIRYVNKKTSGSRHRPAKLYEFKSTKVLTLEIL